MPGKSLPLALALALGLAATAGAQSSLTVIPIRPTPDERPLFSLVYTTPLGECNPYFTPLPTIAGSVITFHGTPTVDPLSPSCQGTYRTEWQIDPLPAGFYRARVEVGGREIAARDFEIALPPLSPPPLPPAVLTVDPRLPTTSDLITLSATVATNCPTAFGIPLLLGPNIVLQASVGPVQSCTGPTTRNSAQATIGPLHAGAYIVYLEINGQVAESQGITVHPRATTLPLVDGRFAVTLSRPAPSPNTPGFAVPLTDQSGYFWFFDATNVEVTVKILDGRPVNGHYWVFVASMTNLPFTLSIQDLGSPLCGPGGFGCPVKVYTAKPGVNENFIDVGSL
ncbi:MAG: hypothetical protein QOJ16_18 [Acidobacteriota bacterium]|jgi:hypothetical protein|nr:hypothetical protein [Acidobacteriota bacterium]